ncbi:MAG: dihydropteroate synthase, partial [Gemmatimonadota bacterium]
TRPGSEGIPAEEELRRVEPVLERLEGLPVSIDTSKAQVARRAVELGAIAADSPPPGPVAAPEDRS